MAILLVFLMGIANFAIHRAVLDSGHPILAQMGWFYRSLGGRFSLAIEFALLVGTLLLVTSGGAWWAWGYGIYTAMSTLSAWLILTGRV